MKTCRRLLLVSAACLPFVAALPVRAQLSVDKARALEEAYAQVRRLNDKAAEAAADALRAKYPNDPYVAILDAEILLLRGDAEGAVAGLQTVKAQHYAEGAFPGQPDLARGLYRLNRIDDAARAYEEVIDNPFFPESTRREAAMDLRQLRIDNSGLFEADVFGLAEDEGDALRVHSFVKSPAWGDWRAWVWGRRDDIRLSETLLRNGSADRNEGGVSLERRLKGVFTSAVTVGASEDDIIGGIAFTGNLSGRSKAGLKIDYNARAEDSLTLEALDGREHRVELWGNLDITPRVYLESHAYARQVELLDRALGNGWGGEVKIGYLVIDSKVRRPSLRVGYAGEVHVFDADRLGDSVLRSHTKSGVTAAERRALADGLVEEEINLHGPEVTVEGRWNDRIAYFIVGAAQYDFFDEDVQFRIATGLEVFLTDRIRMTGGVEYLSAGQTASSDSGVVLGNVGVSMLF